MTSEMEPTREQAQPGGDETPRSREWLGQLQAMIENLAEQATPVVKEIGAKAAELAALAGEKAGPVAHRAAEVTAGAGTRIAERSRVIAADLRRDVPASGGTSTATAESPAVAPTESASSNGDDRPPAI